MNASNSDLIENLDNSIARLKDKERRSYKCRVCLAVFAVEGKNSISKASCQICEQVGSVEFFGIVERDKAIPTDKLCKCDLRCVHASGPKCNCACGGENHMTGTSGYTLVARQDDSVYLTINDPKVKAKHRAIGLEYLELLNLATAIMLALPGYSDFSRGIRIPYADWKKIRHAGSVISKCKAYASHGARCTLLKKLIFDLSD